MKHEKGTFTLVLRISGRLEDLCPLTRNFVSDMRHLSCI